MRLLVNFLLVFTLLACAPRGELTLYAGAGEVGTVQKIFVSTTRDINAAGFPTGKRNENLLFGRVDVSIPENREPGSIKWPAHREPDPSKHFLVDDFAQLQTPQAFEKAIARELGTKRGEGRTAILFVHGFNTRFSEGLYRFAQLINDLSLPFIPVHYSWPSAGHPLGYGYDRDSMLFARDGLEKTLRSLENAGVREIMVVGHSMGALLTMETLRQMAIGKGKTMDRIKGVLLMSPDIDIDLFHQQARRIGTLPQPFYIFSSTKDRALRISAGLTGQKARLGNTNDVAMLANLNVTMVDVSEFSDGELDHNVALASPSFLKLLQSIPDLTTAYGEDPSTRLGLLPGSVLVVQNATKLVIPNTVK